MEHFPAGGEIVIGDHSWYNRAGAEHVMGFCTKSEYKKFLELCPTMEKYVVDSGIILIKYWLEVGKKEQQRPFEAWIKDPLRQWKFSTMDLESFQIRIASNAATGHERRFRRRGSPEGTREPTWDFGLMIEWCA